MTTIIVTKDIEASPATVFAAVADVARLPESSPDVVAVDFLSEQQIGKGTRFIETRRMRNKEMKTELEVTEFVQDESARFVTETNGTIWDTLFTVTPVTDGSNLEIRMDALPQKLLPKLLIPVMQSVFRKGMQKHIVALAEYCESEA